MLIDCYAHVGAPRFLFLEDYKSAMRAMGVSKAMICPFENCADLVQVHSALDGSGALRAYGLPMGRDRTETERGLLAQLEAGFEGFRIAEGRIEEMPEILDVIGRGGGIPMVVGSRGLASQARRLRAFLDRWPESVIVSPHFAGPTALSIFEQEPDVAALFDHPNFYVVYSRQTLFDQTLIGDWAAHVAERTQWRRVVWGSELPVPFWRDETMSNLVTWAEKLTADPNRLADLRYDNAERAFFSRPVRPVAPLRLPFDPRELEIRNDAPMWPFGFQADTRLPALLVREWRRAGGEDREPLSKFASRLMLDALEARRSEREDRSMNPGKGNVPYP
jgi:predicted TIM-barrel fold metal-dependent hydrolase